MLFEADRHEPLTDPSWDEGAARQAIERITRDAEDRFGRHDLWPIHPFDVSPERAAVLKPIYYGAAGVIWALDHLAGAGAIASGRDYAPYIRPLLEAQRRDSLELSGRAILGLQLGEAGILLLEHALARERDTADQLYRAVEANATHPALGFAWGGAGSMLAALFMFERTQDERWSALFLRVVEELWRVWERDDSLGAHLFLTDLYGAAEKRMSALHGLPGIVFPMLRGRHLLSRERAETLVDRTLEVIRATAVREGPFASWPLSVGDDLGPGVEIPRVQHCIGAPGIINSFATELPAEPEVDALLIAGGELTWHAGPLVKMPSLCHGVPGSGYAFLKLFARTGDAKWLERARRFAMHAIEQNQRFTTDYGVRKYSLWTGDLGLAVYLWSCVEASASLPTMDVF